MGYSGLARRGCRTLAKCGSYYNGEHKMAFTTSQFRQTFGNLFAAFADNWCDLVVDAAAERLRVEGFRFGDTAPTPRRGRYGNGTGLTPRVTWPTPMRSSSGVCMRSWAPTMGWKAPYRWSPPTRPSWLWTRHRGAHRLAGLRTVGGRVGSDTLSGVYLPE